MVFEPGRNTALPTLPAGRRRSCRAGFSFVELLMVIVIMGALAVVGGSVMGYLVQTASYVPNQLNMDMLVSDALELMIEGDGQSGGLRSARSVATIQDYQVVFTDQEGRTVRYRLDTNTSRLYRSINGGADVMFPYYVPGNVTVAGRNNKLFTYYDVNETVTPAPANVRWITMTLSARTGTGDFDSWEGASEMSSSVAVSRYQ